jgi:hypothetical protein
MKKTPVSMLQEMMVKKGSIPNYQLIYNGGGSHQNIFTFQVSCDDLKASGTGRCKKDAKHEAAIAMLEAIAKQNGLLQLPASPCESPVRNPSPVPEPISSKSLATTPFRNTIGELMVFILYTKEINRFSLLDIHINVLSEHIIYKYLLCTKLFLNNVYINI